ncbi:MAG: M48 family metallopeptidase [Anaerolineae bacterium]|nr:M48 family metallopeptidase [Anaerolineae bacterium]
MTILGGTHQVKFGASTIEYELVYAPRKTLSIHVHPDSSVLVKAPLGTDAPRIEAFVLKKAAWVLKHQRQFQDYPVPNPLPKRYVSGEAYRYLGRQYRLKVVEDDIERVQLSRGFLTVSVADTNGKKRIAELLDGWFHAQARRIFEERLAVCFSRVESLGIEYPQITIREMKARWGSCSAKRSISLNLKLIHVPKDLIDYVVLHELCHLKELNHGPKFYALLDKVLPDWRDRKRHLDGMPLT